MAGRVGGTELDIIVSGVVPTVEMLEGIADRAANLDPALEVILALLLGSEQALWRRSSRKWMKTLSEQVQERHLDEGTKALVKSGVLMDSFTKQKAMGAIRKAHGTEMVFGSSVFYAKFQDKKKRKILVFRPKDKKRATEVLLDHMMGRLM